MEAPRIEAGEIALRGWRVDDVPAIVDACQDPELSRWLPMMPYPYSEQDAREYVARTNETWAAGAGCTFAVVDAATGDLLGSIGMRLEMFHSATIGYWVRREARGRGVARRALVAASRWSFDELGLKRMQLLTDPENEISQRVAERAGYTREAVLRSHLEYQDGRRSDSIMFSLLPGELESS